MIKLSDILADLQKYPIKGGFQFKQTDRLSEVCDIPAKQDYSGLYLFYTDNNELIYIGISGREDENGAIVHRQDGLRGRFIKGKQFGERRSISIPNQMKIEGILSLKIKWFVTYGDNSNDFPRQIEKLLIETFKTENQNRRPKWNKKD